MRRPGEWRPAATWPTASQWWPAGSDNTASGGQDPELALTLPRLRCIRTISEPSDDLTDLTTYVFVVVSLLDLPSVATFIRETNQRHYLRGLFVRDDVNSHLLPQILQRANLRTVRNLVVHSDPEVPTRVLRAYCTGAEEQLIADARRIGSRLFLISCSGDAFDLSMDEHPGLRRIPHPERDAFVIPPDGAYIQWPNADVHLDLENTRVFLDPVERERVRARKAQANTRFGKAMASVRRSRGLRQSDIDGLSERQIRRYESGTHVPLASLRLLAMGHRMELDQYLDELARAAN